jgi:hypothetical protein
MVFPIFLLQIHQLVPAPVCMILVWTVLFSLSWFTWATLGAGWHHLRKLHQVPCDRCAFFTGDYRLKCTVHPYKAFTEEATHCIDFEPHCPAYPIYRHPPKIILKRLLILR